MDKECFNCGTTENISFSSRHNEFFCPECRKNLNDGYTGKGNGYE